MEKLPQTLLNVEVSRRFDPTAVPAICEAVRRLEQHLAGEGRIVLRASGTEAVIRVMVEGRDAGEVRGCADELARIVRGVAPV
jgi:phosphoglucosamine mutase